MISPFSQDVKFSQCAIYARYSTNMQRPESLEDQERCCREAAEANGWVVLNDHVFTDAARTGRMKANRPGLADLEKAVKSPDRTFDRIVFDDTSRLSRDLGDI